MPTSNQLLSQFIVRTWHAKGDDTTLFFQVITNDTTPIIYINNCSLTDILVIKDNQDLIHYISPKHIYAMRKDWMTNAKLTLYTQTKERARKWSSGIAVFHFTHDIDTHLLQNSKNIHENCNITETLDADSDNLPCHIPSHLTREHTVVMV